MVRARVVERVLRPELNIPLFLVLSLVSGSIMSRHFLDFRFLLSSTTIYVELGIIAIALTLLMVSGEIDLSVASMMTLVACVVAKLYSLGVPMSGLIVIGLMLGVLLGFINGMIVTMTGLPSLIVTLGAMSLYRGLAQVLIGNHSIAGFPSWFTGVDLKTVFRVVPVTFVLMTVLAILAFLVLGKTFFGRRVVAIGLNRNVASYSLVNVKKTKVILFMVLGLFCAIAGLLSMSRLQLARYNIGIGAELDVITMVLLGGTAFEGGRGNPLGTAGAFLIIVFVRTGLLLGNYSNHAQIAVLGSLLIVVLMLSTVIESLRKKIF